MVDPDLFKQGLRRWASGVTVVTARAGEERHGMTVSAFSSVSADPPMVLVCANRESRTHAIIAAGGRFNVNILAQDQRRLSDHFASSRGEGSRFDGVAWRDGDSGVPVLEGVAASLECLVVHSHTHGSHTVYIGQVEAARVSDVPPLLYFDGGYRALAE